MNVGEFLRGLLRRPVALVVIAVLAVAAGVIGWTSVKPTYQSTASVLAIPPGAGSPVATDNPFIHLDSGMPQLAVLVSTLAVSDDARSEVAKTGASTTYEVVHTSGDSSAAQLTAQTSFTVTADDPETARRGVEALVVFLINRLHKVQIDAGVPAGSVAGLRETVPAPAGTALPTSALRTAAASAVATFIAGVLVLLLATAAIRYLKRVRRGRTSDAIRRPGLDDQQSADDADLGSTDHPAAHAGIPTVDSASQAPAPGSVDRVGEHRSGFGGWFGDGSTPPRRSSAGVRPTDRSSAGDNSGRAYTTTTRAGRQVSDRASRARRDRTVDGIDAP